MQNGMHFQLSRKLSNFFPTKPTLHHLCIHQGKKLSMRALTIGQQLNKDSKKLASIGLQILEPKPIMSFDPNAKAQIDFDRCTIKQNIKAILREKIHMLSLQKYCKKCMGWYPRTFDDIDWDIFQQVYKRIYNGSTSAANRIP